MQKESPNGNDQVELIYTDERAPQIQVFERGRWVMAESPLPLIVWTNRTGQEKYLIGYQTADDIAKAILQNDPPGFVGAVPVGAMPTLNDNGVIKTAIEYAERYLGPDVQFRIEWQRRGGKKNLIFNEQHSKEDILGTSGHLVIDISSFERHLRIHHEMDFDLAALEANDGKVGSPLLIAWTIISVAHDIYQLLHPKVSLFMPETIVINGQLKNGKAAIDFGSDPPQIKMLWSFWFQLLQYEYSRPLTGLGVSPSVLEVQFHQSKFYRDLEIPVQP